MILNRFTKPLLIMVMVLGLTVSGTSWASDDQITDPNFDPIVTNPTYIYGQGPVVAIDEAHNNFHTKDGRFLKFAELLTNDGYQVESNTQTFTGANLERIDILVIANALHISNVGYENWNGEIGDAFETAEIKALDTWVKGGGSLMLIADHYPFPKAAEKLGWNFGFIFSNGYCLAGETEDAQHNMITFTTDNNTLSNSSIVMGRNFSEAVSKVVSFTGQAFWLKYESTADKLMILPEGTLSLYPTEADGFTLTTQVLNSSGMLQGAALELEQGRVAVFGEAEMFSAQISTTDPYFKQGMNNAEATENLQFTLNILHWLSMDDIDDDGVTDEEDTCSDTPEGESVDANGCADCQKDTDGDGVTDDKDQCSYTPAGEVVGSDGCIYVDIDEGDDSCFIQTINFKN